MKHKNIFVTGIDTDVGKTVVSSFLVRALQADYWKPIQCGIEEGTDSQFIKKMCRDSSCQWHQESYLLDLPKSPHYAAEKQQKLIQLNKVNLPQTDSRLIVEGAGGVLVPLNEHDYIVDIAQKYSLSTILVTKNYLGSLNHTFLSIESLRQRKINILGLVFNGASDPELEAFVSRRSDLPILFNVPVFPDLTRESTEFFVKTVKNKMENFL